jgi:hypothetical protein
MKRIYLLFFILLSVPGIMSAQKVAAVKKVTAEKEVTNDKHVIDARPLLNKFYKANGIDFTKMEAPQNSLKKTASWGFSVGTQRTWWAINLVTEGYYSTPTTCRGIGNHCYIFVEDSVWTSRVDQNAVDQIINAFDNTTPANASKGVYQTMVDTFGDAPDIDGDPKIIIVILNIPDGYNGSSQTGFTAGYFTSGNEYSSSIYPNSNVGEFYYMDCNPLDLETQTGSASLTTALQITAHEFQHMIEWNYHRTTSNSEFFNEGCSMIAEVVCGYPLRLQSNFIPYTNVYTFGWNNNPPNNTLSDYGRAGRFFLYVKEQCGVEALKAFVQSSVIDDNAFNYSVLPTYDPYKRSFANFTVDWWIANFLNNKSYDSRYGYDYSGLPQVGYYAITDPNVSSYSNSIYKQGVSYFSFISGKNLTFTTTASNTNLKLKAIKTGSGGTEVVDVATNATVSMPEFGSTYSNITLMAYHNSKSEFSSGPYAFTFNSSGESESVVKEIAYDQTEPTGVYAWAVGDTMAVFFDGMAGMKLDSIRVALRNKVPITGGVWKAGTTTYLGTKLATFTVAGTSIPSVIDQEGLYPYASPYQNWVTYDLRSLSLDASSAFAVAFPVVGKYTGSGGAYNTVMATIYKSTESYHNFTYLTSIDAAPSAAGWYYISDSDSTIVLYLIRAYVSNSVTGVTESVELLPSSFKLDQNYPNPFNPTTVIRYELPKMSNVQIKIYDALGKEVRSLVNETQTAGTHNLMWDAANNYGQPVSSGVYFYRIVAGDFVQTKKMVLLR